jgi:hypothetical protein
VFCSSAYHTLNPNILTSLQAINVSDISELRPGSHALAFVRSGSTANDKEVSVACRLSCTAVSVYVFFYAVSIWCAEMLQIKPYRLFSAACAYFGVCN